MKAKSTLILILLVVAIKGYGQAVKYKVGQKIKLSEFYKKLPINSSVDGFDFDGRNQPEGYYIIKKVGTIKPVKPMTSQTEPFKMQLDTGLTFYNKLSTISGTGGVLLSTVGSYQPKPDTTQAYFKEITGVKDDELITRWVKGFRVSMDAHNFNGWNYMAVPNYFLYPDKTKVSNTIIQSY